MPWKATVTSAGVNLKWGEQIGVVFDIPPGAVPRGKRLDLSIWPCSAGPFLLPEGYEPASPVYLITPSFEFSHSITLNIHHFCAVETKEDCKGMAFLSAPVTPHMIEAKQPQYKFSVLKKGEFKPSEEYGQVSLKHLCFITCGKESKCICVSVFLNFLCVHTRVF